MKRDIDWSVVFLFIVAFLFFILGVFDEDTHNTVIELFISGFYLIYGLSVIVCSEIKQTKEEIMDELKKLK